MFTAASDWFAWAFTAASDWFACGFTAASDFFLNTAASDRKVLPQVVVDPLTDVYKYTYHIHIHIYSNFFPVSCSRVTCSLDFEPGTTTGATLP